jgi:uncharacterized protein YoxC
MLEVGAAILAIALLVLRYVLRDPPKKAREVLTEESATAKAVAEAEAKATKKFGPRP